MKCYFCRSDAVASRAHCSITEKINGQVVDRTITGFIFLCRDHDKKAKVDENTIITGVD